MDYLQTVLAFIVVVSVFHTYLDVRQLKAIKRPEPPAELASAFNPDLYKKTQAYSLDKWWLRFYHGLFSLAQTVALLHFHGLPWLWKQSGLLLAALASSTGHQALLQGEISHTIAFLLGLVLAGMVAELPWGLYGTFVVEQRHGFNKSTLGLFFSDMAKQLLLTCLLMPPIVAGVTVILQRAGPWVPLYLWGFMLGLSLLMLAIYPTLIAPLFNKFEALPEGSLRAKIQGLAASLKFPLRSLYKMDGSRRSAHSNAYMYGFGANKRIVLFDTLIGQCTEEQVVAVLAHELGHWKLRHTPRMFLVGQLVLLAQFCLFTFVRSSEQLFTSFGFVDSQPAFVSLLLFQFISSPLDEVISFLQNVISRRFEFQADNFAVQLGHGEQLKDALLKLEEENKGSMHVDPLYSAYHHSHPPLVQRLRAIQAGAKKVL